MAILGRRQFLKAAGVTAAAAAVGASCRAVAFDAIRTERVDIALPDLDPAHDGLRVAQLSDLHLGPLTPAERVRAAVAAANAFAPDLVVLTGDYLTGSGSRRLRSGPRAIDELLGGLTAPTVAVLGNHDHWVDPRGAAEALTRLGYCVLRNENTTLSLRGQPFTVVGIDDHSTRHADPVRAMRGAAGGSRLVLAHDPLTSELLRDVGAPMLVLSGHTHGGQVNVPPVSLLLPLPYRAGLYRVGSVRLYVNRGIGDTWVPLRVRAPPEVTLFSLRARAPARSGAPQRGS
jgi:uncharacterized protein